MKTKTKSQREMERKIAQRILRLSVARATRKGNVFNHMLELWRIVVEMSHK